jgi:branched-chain amino acid aminotransferase
MLAYVNGDFVPVEEATVSIYDRGFLLGDGIFDTWRTYGGKNVRPVVERHLARMRKSVNYLELPGADIAAEIDSATQELLERNREEVLETTGDAWIQTVITRGAGAEGLEHAEPTRVVMCNPIPFTKLFPRDLYEEGARLVPSMVSQNPFWPVDPRVKSINRLAYARGEQKQVREGPGSWVVLFDNEGFITEAVAAALCIVEGETVVRPPRWRALESVSLEIFCDLAQQVGFSTEERPLTMYDFLNADETYVLSTHIAAMPVAEIDGIPLQRADQVGPKVMEAWVDYVGFDFLAQARQGAAVAAA